MQHIPDITDSDVERIVMRDFGASKFDLVLEMMSSIEVREKPRVMIACLKISKGSIDRLDSELKDAPGYWREVISSAEYPLAGKKWGKIQNMADEQKQEIFDKDWAQYLDWQNGT